MTELSIQKAQVLGRKGVELALRTAGQGAEQRQARKLVSDLPPMTDSDAARVLFLSPRNWAMHVALEGVIASALRLRGAETRFLNCGGGLDICDRSNTHAAPPMPCRTCTRYSNTTIGAFSMPHTSLASAWREDDPGVWDELESLTVEELADVEFDGLKLGELTSIPVKWFLLAAQLEKDPLGPETMRGFLVSARRIAVGFRASIQQWRPDTVFMLNGLFLFESVARAICEEEGIDVVTYERTHRAKALIFARNRPANRYQLDGIWATRGSKSLTETENSALDSYLDSRRTQGHPLLSIWKDAVETRPDRPKDGKLVTLFSNVTWDSSVLGRDYAFSSMHEWLRAVVGFFSDRPEHRLIIRAHPAETKRPGKETREPITEFIQGFAPDLPDNIVILGPDDPTSSYPIMEESDLGLVYTSTVGIEMSVMGKPVVVAGRAHYRGLGFTNDAETPEHFEELLDGLLSGSEVGTGDVELARRYAYAFFFDAPIPLSFVTEPIPGLARLTTNSLDSLMPGADAHLDRICESILQTTGTEVENTYFLERS